MKNHYSLLFCLVASILIRACPVYSEDRSDLKIGGLLCLTGVCAETGTSAHRGIQLAIEEINNQGGVLGREVVLEVEDTREGEGAAATISGFQRLALDRSRQIFIGPTWSTGGVPLIPLVKKRKDVIVISPSLGVSEFNESSERILNLWPHDAVATRALARWAREEGLNTASILSAEDPWANAQAQSFAAEFKNLGGKILGVVSLSPTQTDVRSETLRLRAQDPDIVITVLLAHILNSARELNKLGWSGQLMTIQLDDHRIGEASDSLDGIIFTGFEEPNPSFIERFRTRFNQAPGLSAAEGYDAVYLVKHSVEEVGKVDVPAVADAMLRADFNGATGQVTFDDLGGIKRKPAIFQLKNGVKVKVTDG